MTQIVEGEVIVEQVETLLVETKAYHSITTPEQAEAAAEMRSVLSARWKEVEAQRVYQKEPHLIGARRVDEFFRPVLDSIKAEIDVINRAYLQFKNEQERIRREEEARLREEARKEQERLAAEARLAEAKAEQLRLAAEEKRREGELAEAARMESRAEQQEAKADTAVAQARTVPTPYVPPANTKLTGIATRENWSFRVTDASKLPREYLVPNETAIRNVVRGLKGATNIPGVEVFRDDIVAGTSRRGS